METAPRVRTIDQMRILSFMVCLPFVDVAFVKFHRTRRRKDRGGAFVQFCALFSSKMCAGFAKYFVTLVDRATDVN